MKAGDMIQVTITGISHQGYGIGRCDNIVVFVPGAMLGETVEALVVEYKKKMATAQLQRLIAPSPERIDARCPQSSQ